MVIYLRRKQYNLLRSSSQVSDFLVSKEGFLDRFNESVEYQFSHKFVQWQPGRQKLTDTLDILVHYKANWHISQVLTQWLSRFFFPRMWIMQFCRNLQRLPLNQLPPFSVQKNDTGCMFLWNIHKFPPHYRASHPWRENFSYMILTSKGYSGPTATKGMAESIRGRNIW